MDAPASYAIAEAFQRAGEQYPSLSSQWRRIAGRVGTVIPGNNLTETLLREGEMDVLLRTMEDETAEILRSGIFERLAHYLDYQIIFTVYWIGSIYEILRMLRQRKIGPTSKEADSIIHAFTLLRIQLEKNEVAREGKYLDGQLEFARSDQRGLISSFHVYDPKDPQRAPPVRPALLPNGSLKWRVVDLENKASYELDRRALAERLVKLWCYF